MILDCGLIPTLFSILVNISRYVVGMYLFYKLNYEKLLSLFDSCSMMCARIGIVVWLNPSRRRYGETRRGVKGWRGLLGKCGRHLHANAIRSQISQAENDGVKREARTITHRTGQQWTTRALPPQICIHTQIGDFAAVFPLPENSKIERTPLFWNCYTLKHDNKNCIVCTYGSKQAIQLCRGQLWLPIF